MQERALT